MRYFENFNKTLYNLENNQYDARVVTNILQRSAFLKEITENTAISYEYLVKDSDTPETIAHKLYGDPNRHWIVLLFNRLLNPYYDFPMKQEQFEKYMQNKYGYNIYIAQNQLHHYEKQILKEYYEYNALKYSNIEKITALENKQVNYDTGEVTYINDPETESSFPLPTVGSPVTIESFTKTFTPGNYLNVTVSLVYVSVYDYEFDLNEQRRTIKLLDKSYVNLVETEFKALMLNG